LTTGTGANVGKSVGCVNPLFINSGVFSQTSNNLLLKTAVHAGFLLHASYVLLSSCS
jgi:hypothetical protein